MAGQFANLHEEIIHGFSAQLLGTQAIFCPDNYGNSKEPADIAWVANKCAVLFYLTESALSFDKKKRHNVSQLHRWLRKWKSGIPLKGATGATTHQFRHGDIDHAVGISIIDKGEKWCEYHPEQVAYSKDWKLSGCATLTGAVILELAAAGSAVRDLIFWISFLQKIERPVSEDEMLQAIRDHGKRTILTVRAEFEGLPVDPDYHRKAVQDVMLWSHWMKHSADAAETAMVAADLKFSDALWFALATSALESQIAPVGAYGPVCAMVTRQSGIYQFRCIAGAKVAETLEPVTKLIDGAPGLIFASSLDFGREKALRFAFTPRRKVASLLEYEINQMRDTTLAAEAKGQSFNQFNGSAK